MGIAYMLILIFITTILDTVSTAVGIKSGYIEEANPLLANTFHNHPEMSAVSIILFVSLILYLLYKVQHKVKWMKAPLVVICSTKIAILGIHASWIYSVIKTTG